MRKFLEFLILIFWFANLQAAINYDNYPLQPLTGDELLRVHRECNIWFSLTNFGVFGSFNGLYPDMENPFVVAPGAEFPAGSGIDNLFFGAIWVGAEIDTVDALGNPIIDTVTTVGCDGWWAVYEFRPPSGVPSLWEEQIYGDEDIFAVFTDTCTSPSYIPVDPNDNRPHIPLGLCVTSHSICWNSPGYDKIIFINYYIQNIGNRNLHNAYFGIYYDGDVAHRSENPYGPEMGVQDDLCGSLDFNGHLIAWLADNNGQPDTSWDFTPQSPTGVLGIIMVSSSTSNLYSNFNWWISNQNSDLDWGPQWQSNFDRWGIFPGGGRGTPGGDKAKYQVMSNGERDYDQAFSALDHTADGWIDNALLVDDYANGFDTRYLISFGPFQLVPAEIETLTVALIGGHNFHVDPHNYENHLRNHVNEPLYIYQYYQGLDLTGLLEQADSALVFYNRDLSFMALGPPRNFRVSFWQSDRIGLMWSPKVSPHFGNYRIYRGTSPGQFDPVPISPEGLVDTAFIDTNVIDNTIYYYAISTVSDEGVEGRLSREISVNSGRPHRPENLSATAASQEIDLDWSPVDEHDLKGYIIYKKWPNQDFELIDTTYTDGYIDYQVANGYRWHYTIVALDSNGYVSDFSDTVSAIPMYFDSGILIVNANPGGEHNPDFDSMSAFYDRAIDGYNAAVATHAPEHLAEWSFYTTVVYCKEIIGDQNSSADTVLRAIFRDYIESGGNLIFACARFWATANFFGQRNFEPASLECELLNLEGIIYPSWRDTSFSGGLSVSPYFNDFAIDTLRASRIIYPPVPHDGHLMGIGTIIPRDSSEVIYRFLSNPEDSSQLENLPIGIIHQTPYSKVAVLDFPLYYVTEPASIQILHTIWEQFGEHRVEADDHDAVTPDEFMLLQNYPNPFNATTTLCYSLDIKRPANLTIFNIIGQVVDVLYDGVQEAGEHCIFWSPKDLPSGVYFAKLSTEIDHKVIKMIFLK